MNETYDPSSPQFPSDSLQRKLPDETASASQEPADREVDEGGFVPPGFCGGGGAWQPRFFCIPEWTDSFTPVAV
jgi:hypothetical protein